MDTEIGRLFTWLKDRGLYNNTNIIFIGDNGQAKRVAQHGGTNGAKGSIYNYGIHVPCIISGPAVKKPGRTSYALINTTDLFATILELSGFSNWKHAIPANKKPIDAVSLLPIIKNEKTAVRTYIFSEVFENTTNPKTGKTIRNTMYKLLAFDDGRQEFYKVNTDGLELNNLLTATLSTEASKNYDALCKQLNILVGNGTCRPNKPIANKVSSMYKSKTIQ
jgi:arylsulfatase B